MQFLKNTLILFGALSILSGCTFLSKPQVAGLQVITNDVPSAVYLDGQLVDKTPFIEKSLKPGTFTLRVVPDDSSYVPYDTSVTLNPNALTVVTWKPETRPELSSGVIYEMEPLKDKNSSEISFVTIPDNAIIQVTGMQKDFAPTVIPNIEPGHHEYEVTLPSYESQKHTINVLKGYRMIVKVKLAKLEPIPDTVPEVLSDATPSATLTTDLANATPASLSGVTELGEDLVIAEEASPTGLTGQGATVQITATGYYRNGVESLRIRDQAGPQGKELGFAPVGASYQYLGETKNNWYKISFENQEAWVSGDYSKLNN